VPTFTGSRPPLIRNASTEAAELIRDAIIGGQLLPGQRLKEEELARDLGISRTPIREALYILQTDGLIDSLPNRGAVVRRYSPEDIDEMYQLRALLEGWGVHRAAERITARQLSRLQKSCERFEKLREKGDVKELVKENLRFHSTVLDAADSDRLVKLVRKVHDIPLVYRSYYWYSDEQRLISEHHHKQITNALANREGERAEALMKEHITEARDVVINHLREEQHGEHMLAKAE
jgi:DNA-binding GntR family transcriptional regulator